MKGDTLPLQLYRALTSAATPFLPWLLWSRRRRGKEEAARISERKGYASLPRPPGPLAWVHGASVGEGLALLPLIGRLRTRGFQVLVTTGTVTSAHVVGERLPDGAIHQYAPLDAPAFVRRFLDHWSPDIVLIAESELWPNILGEADARGIPLVLVNARLSARSHDRWSKAPKTIRALLGTIDLCLAQSAADAMRLMDLGAARVQVSGNLKYDVPALPAHPTELARLRAVIGSRPVWLAASTHAGEEEIALAAHCGLLRQFPSLVTIVAPRHPERAGQIAAMARSFGVTPARRSAGETPGPGPQFYIADTIGELGLFYRISSVVFVGKSLAGEGGQNPIEPAKLGAAILHGPNVSNFTEVYAELDSRGGAREVADVGELAQALALMLGDARHLRAMARAASEGVQSFAGAGDKIMQAIEPYVLQMQLGQR
ncbi:MAG: 3-deoxy-D-manno-octulosonic acid transferase [Hyphomicrobiales bacterium]|nr:3-deoxy-D-manno-octulosonic acid transferase [Hyphomicrobiales bacterium]